MRCGSATPVFSPDSATLGNLDVDALQASFSAELSGRETSVLTVEDRSALDKLHVLVRNEGVPPHCVCAVCRETVRDRGRGRGDRSCRNDRSSPS